MHLVCHSSRILSPLLCQECISSYVRFSEDSSRPKQREESAAEACDTYNSLLTSFWHSAGQIAAAQASRPPPWSLKRTSGMAYSSSDTSGSGSGRSRSLKLQPTATGLMDLSEFYTNKGYVSETWWKDYFMTVRRLRQLTSPHAIDATSS